MSITPPPSHATHELLASTECRTESNEPKTPHAPPPPPPSPPLTWLGLGLGVGVGLGLGLGLGLRLGLGLEYEGAAHAPQPCERGFLLQPPLHRRRHVPAV